MTLLIKPHMMSQVIQYGAWQLARLSKQLGVIGGLGAALLLGCGLLYLSILLPLNQKISDAKNTLDKAPHTQKLNLNVTQLSKNNGAEDMAAFMQSLPHADSLHRWLALIDQTAAKQKLLLNRGDYKYSKAKQSQISDGIYQSKYEIVLPVTGQYVQIRQFIAQVLYAQSALALSDLKITRDNSLSPNVDARLVFVLYLQSDLNLKNGLNLENGLNLKSELK